MTFSQSINLTPYAGRVTTACNGQDYVSNRAVAVAVGPILCSDLLFMRRRRVRLCKAESVPYMFYVLDMHVAVETAARNCVAL